jgi:hypothetical protein
MPSRKQTPNPYTEKLHAIREGREQSIHDVAKQIGVSYAYLQAVFNGSILPGYGTAERLAGWALENRNYRKCGRIKTQRQIQAELDKWSQLNFRFPKRLHQRMRTVCNQLQISQSTFLQLALERLLDNEGALKGYDMAIKKVAKVRLQQAIIEAPGIQDILDCEVPWAIKIGGRKGQDGREYHKPIDPKKVVEAINVDSEGAISQDVWWPEDDSDYQEYSDDDLDSTGETAHDVERSQGGP